MHLHLSGHRLLTVRCCLVLGALLTVVASPVRAQGPAQIAVFPVTVGSASLRELAAALDPVLVSKLQELPNVRVATRPALDLPATQLAVDCVGQTRECLRMVTTQSGVDGLISPSLQLVGQETVITILYFDGRAGGDMHAVTRRYGGPSVEREALDGVPGMVRQLFGLPEPVAEPPAPPPLDTTFGTDLDAEPRPTAWPVLPVVLTATGVALLGAGLAFGLASRSSMDDYQAISIDTVSNEGAAKRNADLADESFDRAQTQATLCTIGLAVGGVALATGVTLWTIHLVDRSDRDRDSLALTPQVAPGQLAFQLRGMF